ncbi:MAG TPA: SHOCT domain-containing protein [Negativicutes bacterium]|nr:SHOCT domain-containing protein [Negativicutes bacterium]
MRRTTGNIAATPATFGIDSRRGLRMTKEQFERELRYQTVLAVARTMLTRGLITREEYDACDRKMVEKYNPLFGGLMCQSIVDKP